MHLYYSLRSEFISGLGEVNTVYALLGFNLLC